MNQEEEEETVKNACKSKRIEAMLASAPSGVHAHRGYRAVLGQPAKGGGKNDQKKKKKASKT